MPTSTQAFARIAADHGGVDPTDIEAVQTWYLKTLPTLSPERLESLLEALLEQDGDNAKEPSIMEPAYPREISLPKLDEAQRVPLPLLAEGIVALLRRLLRIRRRSD